MEERDKQNKETVDRTQHPQDNSKKLAVNPDPRANENITDSVQTSQTTTKGAGSEITDGEGG